MDLSLTAVRGQLWLDNRGPPTDGKKAQPLAGQQLHPLIGHIMSTNLYSCYSFCKRALDT